MLLTREQLDAEPHLGLLPFASHYFRVGDIQPGGDLFKLQPAEKFELDDPALLLVVFLQNLQRIVERSEVEVAFERKTNGLIER